MKKLILLIVAAIAAASYLVYAYMNGDPMFGTLAKTMDDLPRNERLGSKRNIVVLGVDGREKDDDPGRSDTLFVVMFDPKSKNVSLLSIPRDTRVRIPGHGWDKINHAYAFGGHKLTQQTTEELLGIQVNNYVMVDFSGFESLVDAIGGIDIDVEKGWLISTLPKEEATSPSSRNCICRTPRAEHREFTKPCTMRCCSVSSSGIRY